MDSVSIYLIWLIFMLDIFLSTAKASDSCGKVEILSPAIAGRNVTFKFSPANEQHNGNIQWRRRGGTNPWSTLPNSEKFVQYPDDGAFYLTLTSSQLKNDEVNYIVVSNISDTPCRTHEVTLDLTELSGCGMLYLRTKMIIKNGKVELGYYPTNDVVTNAQNYVRYWMRYPSDSKNWSRINLSNENAQETPLPNNEYVLEMEHFTEADAGEYKVQCSTTNAGQFTDTVTVAFPVPPSTPILSPLKTINSCANCIVGKDNTEVNILCAISGGDKPYNVTMVLAGTQLAMIRNGNNTYSGYIATIRLNDTMHQANLTCSVRNYAITSPLTATASIYVTKLSYAPPSLLVPSRLIEGQPVNITCQVSYVRPPATNITMYIDGTALDGLEIKQELNDVTQLYTSWVTLTKFQRNWNQKDIACCEYNEEFKADDRKVCSSPKSSEYVFPPSSVTIHIDVDIQEEREYYILKAKCYVNNSSPVCNATLTAPNDIVVDQGQQDLDTNPDDGSITTIYLGFINVSVEDNGNIVTCTPSCNRSFVDLPSSSQSILVPYVPDVKLNTSSVIQISRGSVMYVKCTSQSYPPSNITWYDAVTNTTISCREHGDASSRNGHITLTTASRSDIDHNGITECTVAIDAQNSSIETFQLFCRAHHIFRLINKSLTINVEESIEEDNPLSGKQLPTDVITGIGAGVAMMVIFVILILVCKHKKTKGDENPAPADIEINEQDQNIEPLPTNECQAEQNLVYADLEFDVNTDSSINPVLKRRESPVEYITVDFVKTVEMANDMNNAAEAEHIYTNQ